MFRLFRYEFQHGHFLKDLAFFLRVAGGAKCRWDWDLPAAQDLTPLLFQLPKSWLVLEVEDQREH